MRKSYHELDNPDLARICHEAHLALRIGLDDSADDVHWDALPQERKDVVVNQVKLIREGKSPAEVHQAWIDHQLAHGWRYGTSRNRIQKTHPNLVPYEKLSVEEQAKVRQAFRIVFTHVMPDCLEKVAYKDIRTRPWSELAQDLDYDTGAVVCTAHMRFIPCRKDDGTCNYSEDPADIDRVYRSQNEEIDKSKKLAV